jgi:biotin carboxyl carrier protein
MQKRFRVNVDGRDFDVVVEEIAGEHVAPLPMPATAPAAPVVAPPAPRAAAMAVQAGAGEQTAPLGGVVESLPVTVGQTVAAGDVVAVIEAMKMKTEVVSHVAGTVRSIPVAVGQPVEAGTILVVIG